MVFLTEEEIGQLEFLLDQSVQGIHHLFDTTSIRASLTYYGAKNFTHRETDLVSRLLQDLAIQPTISMKRAFVGRLSETERKLLVRSYFNLVENTIYDTISEYH